MTVEDDDVLERELADDQYLREAFRKPRRYLPPPGTRLHHGEEGQRPPEPENKLARRAKLVALLIATALLIASVVIAASLAGQADADGADGAARHSLGATAAEVTRHDVQPG